jgi:hypothetical protein
MNPTLTKSGNEENGILNMSEEEKAVLAERLKRRVEQSKCKP